MHKLTLLFLSVAFDSAAFPSHQPENEQKRKLAFILFFYTYFILFFSFPPSFFHVFWVGGLNMVKLWQKNVEMRLHLG